MNFSINTCKIWYIFEKKEAKKRPRNKWKVIRKKRELTIGKKWRQQNEKRKRIEKKSYLIQAQAAAALKEPHDRLFIICALWTLISNKKSSYILI